MKDEMKKVCRMAVGKWGTETQLRHAQEEAGELIVAISHYLRDPSDYKLNMLITEIADAEIMLEQMKFILALEDKTVRFEEKLADQIYRIKERLR